MELAKANYPPDDAFTLKIARMTFTQFEHEFNDTLMGKEAHNAYQNRMRPKNMMYYYLIHLIEKPKPKMKDASTMTTNRVKLK
tara:strand:- start:158 stop:406 length:249 start_codon:yes stop_codon:yes gene_type:complete